MRVGVLGAGAIGTYVGGRLSAAGHDVVLVGRAERLAEIASRGVVLEDVEGPPREARPRCAGDASALRDCEVVLITTKVAGLESAAASLRDQASVVIGLQNGVEHPRVLRDVLGRPRARAGSVSWNVVWRDGRTLRRSTTGPIVIEQQGEDAIVSRTIEALEDAKLPARGADPIEPVLWTKLLFNLNNAINALSGLPLREELGTRAWRRVVAACQLEGLAAMRAAGLRPVRIGRLDARLSSLFLPAPDRLFRVVAGAMIRIDPAARSSMADDLASGRMTEIDHLNGAVVELGARHGVPTPVNARVVAAIRRAERGEGVVMTPESLLHASSSVPLSALD
ncbi:MAG: 2-dehydropantoate 2-reductase [Myxococcota bacterium]|nr:2-dehydropantoate 2-reductase [Myxococcota bacterium]